MGASEKTKSGRGPRTGPRLVLKMATFCRSIALEPDTRETSILGVLPGLKVKVATLKGTEQGPFNLSIPLWVYVLFGVEEPPAELTTVEIEAIFELTGQTRFTNLLNLEIRPGESLSTLNIRVAAPNGIPLIAGIQTFRIDFKHNSYAVGTVEMPITLTITASDKLG